MRSLIAGGLALFVLAACSKPEPPKLVPKELTLTGLAPAGASLVVRVEATNPNRVTLSARSMTAKVKLDGRWDLGTVTIAKPVVLPPGAPTMVDVPMTLPWSDLKAVGALAAATGPVPYVLEGTVAIGGERFDVDVPFTMSGTLTREEVIGAALKSLPTIPGLPATPPR